MPFGKKDSKNKSSGSLITNPQPSQHVGGIYTNSGGLFASQQQHQQRQRNYSSSSTSSVSSNSSNTSNGYVCLSLPQSRITLCGSICLNNLFWFVSNYLKKALVTDKEF